VSISPIFYEQLYHTKVFCAAFMCSQLGFVISWRKNFGAKAAHNMLVKLAPVLFIIGSWVLWVPYNGTQVLGSQILEDF
jgi:hypothetical protein